MPDLHDNNIDEDAWKRAQGLPLFGVSTPSGTLPGPSYFTEVRDQAVERGVIRTTKDVLNLLRIRYMEQSNEHTYRAAPDRRIADVMQVSKSLISKWRNGTGRMSDDQVFVAADLLGLDPVFLHLALEREKLSPLAYAFECALRRMEQTGRAIVKKSKAAAAMLVVLIGGLLLPPEQARGYEFSRVNMGKKYTEIDESIQRWMNRQQLFFVSTAPLQSDGHVNCSPKGFDSLVVLGPKQLAYVDLGGSGIETVAHIKQNGRITLMMCAFEGPPKIFRFYGRGVVTEPHDAEFGRLLDKFPPVPCVRNIVTINVERIMDSCGYGVPMYDFRKQRDSVDNYLADKSESFLRDYRRRRNATSLDGLTGLDVDNIPD